MHPIGRDPKNAIAEQYAAKAARAAMQGDHRRAAELYRAALRAIKELEECDAEPAVFAFGPVAEEARSGIRRRDEEDVDASTGPLGSKASSPI
jgi:hypothetical protein